MKAQTRLFGEIDIAEDKIIYLENGMIGLPDFQKFALIFDEEKGIQKTSVMWLQSMDDPQTAFPVMNPADIKSDYNPMVNDEVLSPIGELTEDNTYVLVTLTAASDPKKATVNLKAPIVINTETRKGCQIIVEDDYPVKYNIYEAVSDRKKEAEE
jgi:flagellar assembly factor FliW